MGNAWGMPGECLGGLMGAGLTITVRGVSRTVKSRSCRERCTASIDPTIRLYDVCDVMPQPNMPLAPVGVAAQRHPPAPAGRFCHEIQVIFSAIWQVLDLTIRTDQIADGSTQMPSTVQQRTRFNDQGALPTGTITRTAGARIELSAIAVAKTARPPCQ